MNSDSDIYLRGMKYMTALVTMHPKYRDGGYNKRGQWVEEKRVPGW